MLLPTRRTAARLTPDPLVATAFICPDGGKPNIGAKLFATLWYLLIVNDAQHRLQQQMNRKRVPWYAPSRMLGVLAAAGNIVTMPLSWGLLFLGRKNASRLACLGVLMNPPSLGLGYLIFSELSAALVRKSVKVVGGAGRGVVKPFVALGKLVRGTGADGDDPAAVTPTQGTTETTAATKSRVGAASTTGRMTEGAPVAKATMPAPAVTPAAAPAAAGATPATGTGTATGGKADGGSDAAAAATAPTS